MIAACEDEGATVGADLRVCPQRGEHIGSPLQGEFYMGFDIGRKRDLL